MNQFLAATPKAEETNKIVEGMEDLHREEDLVCNHFQLDTFWTSLC